MISTYPVVRKVGVAVVGFSVLTVGVALIVLPGPAILVIPLGLAILGKEFPWAQRLLDRARGLGRRLIGTRRLRSLVRR
jgi:hypothetical protein